MSERDNLPLRGGRGGYEAWYLEFTDPRTGQGFWIRTDALGRRGGAAQTGVWFARFDPADPDRTFGVHERLPGEVTTGARAAGGSGELGGEFALRAGDAAFSSGRAHGSIHSADHEVRWDLSFGVGEPTYRLIPRAFGRRPTATMVHLAANVDTRVSGVVEVDGEAMEMAGAPAQQGHLAGRRHEERWAWAHCGTFEDEEAVVEALSVQYRRGPFLTPNLTFVGVRWRGRWIRLSRVARRRAFGLGLWRVEAGNRRYRLTGRVEAPPWAMVRARLEDPDGTPRFVHHSGIASCRLALFERTPGGFEEVAVLESRGGANAEWAGRTPARAVQREVSARSGGAAR